MHDDEWYRRKYGTFDGGKGFNSKDRVRKFGEVFTPRWMVEKMLDEVPDVENVEKTVFEPCCGEGAFITCVLRRKLARARTDAERVRACARARRATDSTYSSTTWRLAAQG